MNESNQQIEKFLEEFGDSRFQRSEELIQAMRHGKLKLRHLSFPSQPIAHFLAIYEVRCECLGSQDRTPYVRALKDDVQSLCESLKKKNPAATVEIWSFLNEASKHNYTVFVGWTDRTVLGCIRTRTAEQDINQTS